MSSGVFYLRVMVMAVGFFGKNDIKCIGVLPSQPLPIKHIIHVGACANSGFRAMAAALMDLFIDAQTSNQKLAAKLLTYHAKFIIDKVANNVLFTPIERLKNLMQRPAFFNELSFILRQIAVDTMINDPGFYKKPFVNQTDATYVKHLRDPSHWIDETSIMALSTALELSITLKIIHYQKELPLVLQYGDAHATQFNWHHFTHKIVIQLHNRQYQPLITHVDKIKQIILQNVSMTEQLTHIDCQDPDLESIQKNISHKEELFLRNCQENHRQLMQSIEPENLSNALLIELYLDLFAKINRHTMHVYDLSMQYGHEFDALCLSAYPRAENQAQNMLILHIIKIAASISVRLEDLLSDYTAAAELKLI